MVLLLTMIIGLGADLSSKSWSFANVAGAPIELDRETLLANPAFYPVPYHEGRDLVPHLVRLRLAVNRGAVFGVAANRRTFFIGFTTLALAGALIIFARMTDRDSFVAHLGLGLVLAGGAGNLHDRIFLGVVRDFLHLLPNRQLPYELTWPGGNPELLPWVFNLADLMLLTGMVLLLYHLNRRRWRMALNEGDATAILSVQERAD
ncbi:MAG: signal peptidase II [Planctomycetota bacterium]|jgi:lipoprotein signal peptidase